METYAHGAALHRGRTGYGVRDIEGDLLGFSETPKGVKAGIGCDEPGTDMENCIRPNTKM